MDEEFIHEEETESPELREIRELRKLVENYLDRVTNPCDVPRAGSITSQVNIQSLIVEFVNLHPEGVLASDIERALVLKGVKNNSVSPGISNCLKEKRIEAFVGSQGKYIYVPKGTLKKALGHS
jgi:hypothetical protein